MAKILKTYEEIDFKHVNVYIISNPPTADELTTACNSKYTEDDYNKFYEMLELPYKIDIVE